MRARHILVIVENLPVPFDRRVWAEARALTCAGYKVSVICPRGKYAETAFEVIEGVAIYRHPLPPEAAGPVGYLLEYGAALFWELFHASRIYLKDGFDAIHACNPPDLIFLVGAVFKYLFGVKFISDHHDLNPELFEAKFGTRGALWKCLLMLERLTFAVADISIATNESYRKIAIARGRMRADRVFTVRSGPDTDRVKPGAVDPAWRNGRKYLIAYVGVIGPQEGIDLLLEAVHWIVNSRGRKDLQVVVMGSGPELESVRRLSERMGLAEFVTFTGRVDDETMLTVLTTADVCVNPDRPNAMNNLSTMNKIMEYMAMGKPIVQFDLVEGRVSAQDSSLYARNTDVTDFAEKILELLADPERRKEMGERGRRRVLEELSWSHEAPKLIAAYRNLFPEEVRCRCVCQQRTAPNKGTSRSE